MQRRKAQQPWRVSLHGGHSGEFCGHAEATLREMLEAAVEAGYHAFGVSEHAPRSEARFLYPEERANGWDTAKIQADFERYIQTLPGFVEEFADRLIVLRGFEAEVVPAADYAERMRGYREQKLPDGLPAFDYCVGSVHYVEECQVDGPLDAFQETVEAQGGLEALAVRYYETVAEMITALRPEVVGHLDLIKKNVRSGGYDPGLLQTPRVRTAASSALEAALAYNAILDLNTAGWRKGLGEPYPAPWLVLEARRMQIPFCFGDDSHRPAEVGAGIMEARDYLLSHGVTAITILTKETPGLKAAVVRQQVSLRS